MTSPSYKYPQKNRVQMDAVGQENVLASIIMVVMNVTLLSIHEVMFRLQVQLCGYNVN